MFRPSRCGASMRNRMVRIPRYHQKSFSALAMFANSAGFMNPLVDASLSIQTQRRRDAEEASKSAGAFSVSLRLCVKLGRLRLCCRGVLPQLVVYAACRALSGDLLRSSVGLPGPFLSNPHLDGKHFRVLRTLLAHNRITRLR